MRRMRDSGRTVSRRMVTLLDEMALSALSVAVPVTNEPRNGVSMFSGSVGVAGSISAVGPVAGPATPIPAAAVATQPPVASPLALPMLDSTSLQVKVTVTSSMYQPLLPSVPAVIALVIVGIVMS